MKKCACLLLLAFLLLCACAPREEPAGYLLYYRSALSEADGADALKALSIPRSDCEGEGTEELARFLIGCILKEPGDASCVPALPRGTILQGFSLAGGTAGVDFSQEFAALSGIDLTLADYAVVMTLTQLPEIYSVRITVDGKALDYQPRQLFRGRDLLMTGSEDQVSTVTLTIFCLDGAGALAVESRSFVLYDGDSRSELLLRALAEEPQTPGLRAALSGGLQISSVWVDEGICYVNLPGTLSESVDRTTLQAALDAVARSFMALSGVTEVQFLVDGTYADSYAGVPLGGEG